MPPEAPTPPPWLPGLDLVQGNIRSNQDGTVETEVEPNAPVEVAEVTTPPCLHLFPFLELLHLARPEISGKPLVHRPTEIFAS